MIWIGQQDLLRHGFGFGIHAKRIDGRGFVVIARLSVEDQISGKEDKRNVRSQLREQGRNFHVKLAGQRGVCFAIGTPAERCAVNDQLRIVTPERSTLGGGVN